MASAREQDAAREIAALLADLHRRVRDLEVQTLDGHSIMRGGTVQAFDSDNTFRAMVGTLPDGTQGIVEANGPVPDAPTPPLVTSRVGQAIVVWRTSSRYNYATDPAFSNGLNGWSENGSATAIERVSGHSAHGQFSGQITWQPDGTVMRSLADLPLTVGEFYTVAMDVTGPTYVEMAIDDEKVSTDTGTRLSVTFRYSGEPATVVLSAPHAVGGEQSWIASWSVTPGTADPGYFDGDTPGYMWTGDARASSSVAIEMPQSDAIHMEVHVGHDALFLPTADTRVGAIPLPAGGQVAFPLAPGTYWVRGVLVTSAGRYSAPSVAVPVVIKVIESVDLGVNSVTGPAIAPEAVTTEHIKTRTLTGRELAANLILGTSIQAGAVVEDAEGNLSIVGQHVDIGPGGVFLYDAAGNPVVVIPTDVKSPVRVVGNIETASLRVLGNAVIQGTGNKIASGGTLEMAAGASAPTAIPTMQNVYDTVTLERRVVPSSSWSYNTFGSFALDPANITAIGWHYQQSCYLVAEQRPQGTRFWQYNTDGTVRFDPGTNEYQCEDLDGWSQVGGCFSLPNMSGYVFGGWYNGTWFWLYKKTDGVDKGRYNTLSTFKNTTQRPVFGYNPVTAKFFVAESYNAGANDNLVVRELNGSMTSAAESSIASTMTGALGTGRVKPLAGLAYTKLVSTGPYRYVYGVQGANYTVTSLGGPGNIDNLGEDWPQNGSPLAFCYDGAYFRSVDAGGVVTKYENTTWPETNLNYYAGLTAYDSNTQTAEVPPAGDGTHETNLSTLTPFTAAKRARLRVTVPAVAAPAGTDDPDSWRLYMCRAAAPPDPSQAAGQALLFRQSPAGQTKIGAQTVPVSLDLVDLATDPTTHPPAANNFPGGNPAHFQSTATWADGSPRVHMDGSGSQNIVPIGAIILWPSTAVPIGYAVCDGRQVTGTGDYAKVFGVIGKTFGGGDGTATSFNLPDMRGRNAIGLNTAAATYAKAIGQSDGEAVMTDRELRMQHTHAHSIPGQANAAATRQAGTGSLVSPSAADFNGHDHGGSTGTAQGIAKGSVHAYLTLNYLIKL